MPAAKKKAAAPASTRDVKKQAGVAPAPARKKAAPKEARATKAAGSESPAPAEKADKARKPKLVRDSFTIPKNEFAVLEQLKLRAAKLGRPTKKSEVLRAGVMALASMGDAAFLATVTGVPAVKTGRPAKAAA